MQNLVLSSLALVGLLGFFPPGGYVAGWAWLALWAAPCGALVCAGQSPRRALLVPLLWLTAAALAQWGYSLQALPAMAAAAGLWGIGFSLARLTQQGAASVAGALLLLACLLTALPSLGGLAGPAPWSPELAAFFLDLSPETLLMELGGVDWMRHPAVYTAVGADAIHPGLRLPFEVVSGLLWLGLGGLLFGLALWRGRARSVE